MQHLFWRHLSISAISQLLLAWFWPNFKSRFLGPFWTYSNCNNDICPGNICSCDIFPFPEYLSCYWPDHDPTLKVGSWDGLEHISTVTDKKFSQKKKIAKNDNEKKICQKKLSLIFPNKFFCTDKKLCKTNFNRKKFLRKKFFTKKKLWNKIFAEK